MKIITSKKHLTVGFGNALYLVFLLDGIAAGKNNKTVKTNRQEQDKPQK